MQPGWADNLCVRGSSEIVMKLVHQVADHAVNRS